MAESMTQAAPALKDMPPPENDTGSDPLPTDAQARGFCNDVSSMRYAGMNLDPGECHGMVTALIPPHSKVLDVGCGTGDMTAYLRDQFGCEVVGIEPNEERAAATRDKGIPVTVGYLDEAYVQASPKFEAVVFMDVLEHTVDPVEVLRLAARVLSPGGRVYISVPNVANWTVRWNLLWGRFDYTNIGIMDATHLRWFTQKTIRQVIEAAGLEVHSQAVTEGQWIQNYYRPPIRWIPGRITRRIVTAGCKLFPGLFGCQHIVVAKHRRA